MLKTFFLPHGRMGRLRFWRAVAIIGIVSQVGGLVLLVIADGFFTAPPMVLAGTIFGPVLVALFSAAMVGIQRLHDRDRSSWWLLLALVPVGGAVWYLFANGTMSGTPGPNRYGLSTDGSDGEIAAVFDEGFTPPTPRVTGRLVGTILLWLVLLVVTAATGILIQTPSPQRHAARDNAVDLPVLTAGSRHPI